MGSTLKSQDLFSESFNLRIDDGDDSIKSGFGTCCSILLLLVTALYAGLKMKVLEARNDVNILTATKDLHFTDDDVFSYEEHGLNMAIAFTSYSNNKLYELPGDIGELVFKAYSWGTDANGDPFTRSDTLNHHNCTAKELGVGE